MAAWERRVAGERHVDAVLREPAVELGRLELGGPLQRAAPRAPASPRSPVCRPARAQPAGALRSSAARRSGRTCGRAGARAAPRAPRSCRQRLSRSPSARSSFRSGIGGHPTRDLVEGDRRRHGYVERVRCHWYPHRGGTRASGSPAARRRDRGRVAPRAACKRRRRAASSGTSVAWEPCRALDARAGGANTEPMLARTAFGENGSAQPGRGSPARPPGRGPAHDRPTLPGSSTPCR